MTEARILWTNRRRRLSSARSAKENGEKHEVLVLVGLWMTARRSSPSGKTRQKPNDHRGEKSPRCRINLKDGRRMRTARKYFKKTHALMRR
jgi:hypothetical protein